MLSVGSNKENVARSDRKHEKTRSKGGRKHRGSREDRERNRDREHHNNKEHNNKDSHSKHKTNRNNRSCSIHEDEVTNAVNTLANLIASRRAAKNNSFSATSTAGSTVISNHNGRVSAAITSVAESTMITGHSNGDNSNMVINNDTEAQNINKSQKQIVNDGSIATSTSKPVHLDDLDDDDDDLDFEDIDNDALSSDNDGKTNSPSLR